MIANTMFGVDWSLRCLKVQGGNVDFRTVKIDLLDVQDSDLVFVIVIEKHGVGEHCEAENDGLVFVEAEGLPLELLRAAFVEFPEENVLSPGDCQNRELLLLSRLRIAQGVLQPREERHEEPRGRDVAGLLLLEEELQRLSREHEDFVLAAAADEAPAFADV